MANDPLLPVDEENEEKNDQNQDKNDGTNSDQDITPTGPEMKDIGKNLRKIFFSQEETQYSEMRRNAGSEFVSRLNADQTDKLLDMMRENDKNMFSFHSQQLQANKEIALQKIKSKGHGLRTFRSIAICVIVAFVGLTIFIGCIIPEYITQWLAFALGVSGGGIGGYGFAKSRVLDFNDVGKKNPTTEEDDEE